MESIDMQSEAGDIPSDESLSVSLDVAGALNSGRVSECSMHSQFAGLGRDAELKHAYPEFHRHVILHRQASLSPRSGTLVFDSMEAPIDVSTAEGRLFRDALEMCKALRQTERHLREKEKEAEHLAEQNRAIRESYVRHYAKAEQEEEYISNVLLKRIQKLKNDKETLAQKFEQEEEYLTNDLMKRIRQLQAERDSIEGKVKTDQTALIDSLLQTIRRMETEVSNSRKNMERMRKDKIDQENALEHEQELLFNTLGKQMDQLNQEKRKMQQCLQRAFQAGYVTEDELISSLEPALPERPPSATLSSGEVSPSLKAKSARTEMSRLRQALRAKDVIVGELREKIQQKEEQIRRLNEAEGRKAKFLSGVKDLLKKAESTEESDKAAIDVMGPPSVPPLVNNDHDMDETSSRSSFHSDFN